MEKAVFKATRKDAVHPKQKHVDTLIQMTWSGASMEELFMLIQDRFSEANWVISFKALIVVHVLMHDGNGPLIYDYLIHRPNVLDMTRFRDRHGTKGVSAFEQSKNVRTYASYLNDKVLAYKAIRIDHVSEKSPKGSQIYAKQVSDVKFLLLEISTVQKQLHSVLKNRFDSDTFDNETTFSAFRYCLRDMLKLFQVMNLGVMKMLKVYFEIREDDMRRALDLYKRFVKLTDRADEYLKIARRFESIFGFTIPSLTHAPLSLSKALEDFLNMSKIERSATVTEMKKHSKKPNQPQKNVVASMRLKQPQSQQGKPDYGLKLKPALLAMSGDAQPSDKSSTLPRAAHANTTPVNREQTAPASSTSVLASASSAAAVAPTDTEKDFIDFFSSIDDEVTTATNNTNMPTTIGHPTNMTGENINGNLVGGTIGGSNAAVGNMSDFDAMFNALSNPFTATNAMSNAAMNQSSPSISSTAIGNMNQVGQNNTKNDTFGAMMLNQQQQSPFGAAQANPTTTGQFSGIMASGMQDPFTSLQNTSNAGLNSVGSLAMTGTIGVTNSMSTSSFNSGIVSGSSALVSSTPATIGPSSNTANFLLNGQQHQQQQHSVIQQKMFGGVTEVSVNNPFRNSMFPQSDSTAQAITNQISQMSLQQQQQMPSHFNTVNAGSSYNPFAQRQTMCMTGGNTSSTFSNTITATNMTVLQGMSGNTTAATNGFGTGMQQGFGVPSGNGQQVTASSANGNFADFNSVFK